MEQGNTCFVDPKTEEPFADQWEFLQEIERIATSELNQIYSSIKGKQSQPFASEVSGENSIVF